MHRFMTFLVGPESAMLLLTLASYLVAARHGSYSSQDVGFLERIMWLLPVVAVPLAHSTILVPGARNWWWLGRANFATYLGLVVCSVRIVQGFGAPGSGPKGQEIGVFVVMCLGVVFSSIASTSTESRPTRFPGAVSECTHSPSQTRIAFGRGAV